MRKRTKAAIIASVVAIALAVNYWQPPPSKVKASSEELSDADYYFQNVSVKKFDASGKLDSQLDAVKMEHYKIDDYSDIVQPKIFIVGENQSKWQINADKGRLSHQDNQLSLADNTRLSRVGSTEGGSLSTNRLKVNLNDGSASTSDPVIIENSNSKTLAQGMDAQFKQQKIDLIGPVETVNNTNE